MIHVLSSLAATLMTFVLAVGVLAETADDDWVGTLLVVRDELDKGIAQIDREMAVIPERIASDDWRVFPTESGQVVQVDLRVLEEHVPIAQVIAGHPEIKPLLLDAIEQADLGIWASVTATAVVGDIENMKPDAIMTAVRLVYPQSADYKRDAYAAHQAKLRAERDDLAKLRADIQLELDALARAAGASASPMASLEPSADTSPEPTPGMETDGVQYDAFEGLLHCDAADPDCVVASPALESEGDESWLPSMPPTEIEELPSAVPSPQITPEPSPEPTPVPEPSSEPTPGMESEGIEYDALEGLTDCAAGEPDCPAVDPEPLRGSSFSCEGAYAEALEAPYTTLPAEQIAACFEECMDWISWHGSFGDTLPGWCSEPEDSPLAMWEGQWPTNRGVLTLTVEAGRLIGEFESGADSSLAGAQVVLEPGEENRYSAAGRWSNTEGRYECADEFGAEPGYWGEIWLDLGSNDLLFGGFNHCNERGGGWIDMD